MSQQVCTSRGTGQYRASESHQFIFDRMYKPTQSRRGVIFVHGVSGVAGSWQAAPIQDKVLALAAAGYPVISADLSSATYSGANWANADHLSAIDAAWSYLKSALGAKTDKVLLYGSSMGATGALAWAKANLSTVLAIGCTIPCLDIDDIYQNDKGSLRAGIGTAYGVTFPTSLGDLTTHAPVSFGSTALAGLPLRLWSASNDPIASTTAVCQSWGGKGATLTVTDLGAVGHDATTANAQQLVQFFDDNGGRA